MAAWLLFIFILNAFAQPAGNFQWNKNGTVFYSSETGSIVQHTLPEMKVETIASSKDLTPEGKISALAIENFFFSSDYKQILIYTNSKKVWRYKTRGDYWVYNTATKKLSQVGKKFPASSLMFAKFSPDGKMIAYVQQHNIYTEDISNGNIKQLTFDGTRQLINGTFDWAYEEEFFCRDGFRWSPDSKKIAYWQIDARHVKDYLMIDNTDSLYPFVVPVEYPVAGEAPSPFKIGVVSVSGGATKWMNIPTDAVLQSYITRMEWMQNSNELIVQHLTRKQNVSDIMVCNAATGASKNIYHEEDAAWIDILSLWDEDYSYGGWDWLNNGKEFLWASEKDGWRHLYRISSDGKSETLVTKGDYDVMDIDAIDEASGYVYFAASPENATQKYLYRTKLDGSGSAERLTPANQPGIHNYNLSPTGKFAIHNFS
ncbi:MAG TPA: DPP IV N-terminal domain-containing protein, partial [Chitinophagaceae bacterium]|nr:DPP IV N-terminal domain-containing protein [Chitinophagaceae bacterium]